MRFLIIFSLIYPFKFILRRSFSQTNISNPTDSFSPYFICTVHRRLARPTARVPILPDRPSTCQHQIGNPIERLRSLEPKSPLLTIPNRRRSVCSNPPFPTSNFLQYAAAGDYANRDSKSIRRPLTNTISRYPTILNKTAVNVPPLSSTTFCEAPKPYHPCLAPMISKYQAFITSENITITPPPQPVTGSQTEYFNSHNFLPSLPSTAYTAQQRLSLEFERVATTGTPEKTIPPTPWRRLSTAPHPPISTASPTLLKLTLKLTL